MKTAFRNGSFHGVRDSQGRMRHEPAIAFEIRTEWWFEVNSECQRFICRSVDADREEFEESLRVLSTATPAADSELERVWLREHLMNASRTKPPFHLRFHKIVSRDFCGSTPLENVVKLWSAPATDPRQVLSRWTDAFLADFDAHHARPIAGRVAAIVRQRFAEPLDIDALARFIGCSRSSITRAFPAAYLMSIGQYQTRARLRWAIEQLRRPGESIARLAGYRSRRASTGVRKLSWHSPRDGPSGFRSRSAGVAGFAVVASTLWNQGLVVMPW
jgi:AraC-like DNA-binding protein